MQVVLALLEGPGSNTYLVISAHSWVAAFSSAGTGIVAELSSPGVRLSCKVIYFMPCLQFRSAWPFEGSSFELEARGSSDLFLLLSGIWHILLYSVFLQVPYGSPCFALQSSHDSL